jgi:Polyketide cyclase / dehydrase and lipid transport
VNPALITLLLLTATFAGAWALFHNGVYGLTVFVLVPVLVGGIGAWAWRPKTAGQAAGAGALTTAIAVCSLLFVRVEGLICIVMVLPLAALMGVCGGLLVYKAEPSRASTALLLMPFSLMWDLHARPPVYEVRTSVEITAAPEQVWRHVVAFSEMPEPREWYFRAGLAYPRLARIAGSGVGATRFCDLSTGPLVEPIEVWDEPRLLRFRVTETPAAMRELSPYGNIEPKHLHGYLVSIEGQFQLTELPNHHTLLAGTSWYRHGLWPAAYWRWWSDAIIHRIHLRVLNHIRTLAEQDAAEKDAA